MPGDGSLGAYLRERRTRLDAAALGYGGRRRTPGLRREEVAQRAGISAIWYGWLEQGRGGAPSVRALEGLAEALILTDVEREHLFLLGLGRPPQVQYRQPTSVTSRLQRVLDGMVYSPAIIRTSTWDVVAWNKAALAVFFDYAALPPIERNLLRLMFLNPVVRDAEFNWESVARSIVGVFRADAARNGAVATVRPLVDELRAESPEFAAMWQDYEVSGPCGGPKRVDHPELGEIVLEFSSFAIDGRSDLVMLIYTPTSVKDAAKVRALITADDSRMRSN